MAEKHWIAGAIKHKGALHKELGVPKGTKIPAAKLAKAAKAGGIEGKRARLAETLKGLHHSGDGHAKEKTMRRAHENERKHEPKKEARAHEREGMKRAMSKHHEPHKKAEHRGHEARKAHAPKAEGHKHVHIHHHMHHEK